MRLTCSFVPRRRARTITTSYSAWRLRRAGERSACFAEVDQYLTRLAAEKHLKEQQEREDAARGEQQRQREEANRVKWARERAAWEAREQKRKNQEAQRVREADERLKTAKDESARRQMQAEKEKSLAAIARERAADAAPVPVSPNSDRDVLPGSTPPRAPGKEVLLRSGPIHSTERARPEPPWTVQTHQSGKTRSRQEPLATRHRETRCRPDFRERRQRIRSRIQRHFYPSHQVEHLSRDAGGAEHVERSRFRAPKRAGQSGASTRGRLATWKKTQLPYGHSGPRGAARKPDVDSKVDAARVDACATFTAAVEWADAVWRSLPVRRRGSPIFLALAATRAS